MTFLYLRLTETSACVNVALWLQWRGMQVGAAVHNKMPAWKAKGGRRRNDILRRAALLTVPGRASISAQREKCMGISENSEGVGILLSYGKMISNQT